MPRVLKSKFFGGCPVNAALFVSFRADHKLSNPGASTTFDAEQEFIRVTMQPLGVYANRIRRLAFAALLIWLLALFLPAIHTNTSALGYNPSRVIGGFECLWYATLATPFLPWPFLFLALPNYILLLSVALIISRPHQRHPVIAAATIFSVPSALVTLTLNDPLYVGFYCWIAALLAISTAAIMTLRYHEDNVMAEASTRGWVQSVFAIISGLLSMLMFVSVLSSCIILARLLTSPTANGKVVNIIAMTIVMLTTSIAFAHISIGLFRSMTDVWKRGLWILLGGVLGYVAIIAADVAMRAIA